MTKGITKLFMGAAMLASVATAETDLFAKLSNGALSDKSEGIAELSLAEKKQVIGGRYYVEFVDYQRLLYGGMQTRLYFDCTTYCIDNESRWYQQALNANHERFVLVTTRKTMLTGKEYFTHEFYRVSKMDKKTQGRQVWSGKVIDEILRQYKAYAENTNRRYR